MAVLRGSLLALAASAAQAQACFGEFSTCENGSCALTLDACAQCPPTQYACPLSTACFAPGPGGEGFSSCPGLAGTHFDASLPTARRLDFMFATPWTVAEFISQMTENATDIPRLSIPRYSYLNDDQHGVKEADATAFPNGVSLGASFDAALLHEIGLAIGTEARGTHNSLADKSAETGGTQWPGTIDNGAGLTLYAPNINLVRKLRDKEQKHMAINDERDAKSAAAGAAGHSTTPHLYCIECLPSTLNPLLCPPLALSRCTTRAGAARKRCV